MSWVDRISTLDQIKLEYVVQLCKETTILIRATVLVFLLDVVTRQLESSLADKCK